MEKASCRLLLDALSCNWNVTVTPEWYTLTCTWSFGEDCITSVIGLLSLTSFAEFGGAASVSFYLRQGMTGEHQRMYSASTRVSLDTLQSTLASAGVRLSRSCSLHGIHEIGLFSVADLGVYMSDSRTAGLKSAAFWIRSYEAGTPVLDTSIRCTLPHQERDNDELVGLGG